MDKIDNPFSPGAGSPPPELAGRDGVMEEARVLIGRVLKKRSEKSILLTGLRGVGKTVLLNEIERIAQSEGCPAGRGDPLPMSALFLLVGRAHFVPRTHKSPSK